jgi:multidrug transporter EmrE-like cation transporter
MAWVLLLVIGWLGLGVSSIFMRKYGLTMQTYMVYMAVNVFITGWAFPLAVKKAPSFIAVNFVGEGIGLILALVIGLVVFKEGITLYSACAVGLIIAGSIMLILK